MFSRTATLTTAASAAFRSTFAPETPEPVAGAPLPPAWEGLTFPFDTPFADLRPDGSPARDGVLPEIDLPRRMYAGEDTQFHRALHYGDIVEQTVRPGAIAEKTGRTGRLVFADIEREYRIGGEVAISNVWHDVFLDIGASRLLPPVPPPEGPADWSEETRLDARQLFRFSALTFNSHRVHYDASWARDTEALPGLLVHGPLTRILLLDAARRRRAGTVARYRFRAVGPLFVDETVRFEGREQAETTRIAAIHPDRGLVARGGIDWR